MYKHDYNGVKGTGALAGGSKGGRSRPFLSSLLVGQVLITEIFTVRTILQQLFFCYPSTMLFKEDTVLSPIIRPGDVVIMDNLSSHKSKNVEEAINARGAKLIFSPPYSPELSPIEYYWAKMKKYLKKKCAKTRDELDNAIKEACEFIEHSDISGWFRHCGYCI
ncbi:MAG: transposase [Nitrospirae bacterium]|nr:transposase [Nitrospirota bacterium]